MSADLMKQHVSEDELIYALQSSLYVGARIESVQMVLSYCRAAGLDPMQKPVHIVPIWDSKMNSMRDVVMPGIGLYRTQASRTGEFAGMGEPEFGPMITEKIGGVEITYPEYARCTVKRVLPSGVVAEFTAVEYWMENYAVKGGKEKSIAPNTMWAKRPRGQLAKCAQAQALRIAFPELGSAPTAEEMEGKALYQAEAEDTKPKLKAGISDERFLKAADAIAVGKYTAEQLRAGCTLSADQEADLKIIEQKLSAQEVSFTESDPMPAPDTDDFVAAMDAVQSSAP
jgi:phage recombination protein Bet